MCVWGAATGQGRSAGGPGPCLLPSYPCSTITDTCDGLHSLTAVSSHFPTGSLVGVSQLTVEVVLSVASHFSGALLLPD